MIIKKIFKKFKDGILVKNILYKLIQFPLLKESYDLIYFKVIKMKVKDYRPRLIAIETINVCNLNCVMCPYSKMTRKKTSMSMRLYKKIIDDVSKSSVEVILLNFYNEPFLDKDLFERIKYSKKKGLIVNFFSNGTVMDKVKADKILKNPPDRIMFSFDGFSKETYEKIRKGANFEKTLSNINYLIDQKKKLKLTKPEIWMKLVLMDLNKQEVNKFKKLWKERADNIEVGTVDNRSQNDLEIESLRNLNSTKYPCSRAWEDMTIMADGKVTFCCIDFDGKYIVGDMNKQTFNEVWSSKKYVAIRNLHLQQKGDQIPLCKNCSQFHRNSAFSWWSFK